MKNFKDIRSQTEKKKKDKVTMSAKTIASSKGNDKDTEVETQVQELTKENVKTADRKPEIYTKPDGKKGVRMVPMDKEIIKNEDAFKPHMMYDPKTGKGYKANKPEDHERMDKMGYTHEKPNVKEAVREMQCKDCGCVRGNIDKDCACPNDGSAPITAKHWVEHTKESLDEVSTGLLRRYIKKADNQAVKSFNKAVDHEDDKDQTKHDKIYNQGLKRGAGATKARDKLVDKGKKAPNYPTGDKHKRSESVNEISQKTKDSYISRASGQAQVGAVASKHLRGDEKAKNDKMVKKRQAGIKLATEMDYNPAKGGYNQPKGKPPVGKRVGTREAMKPEVKKALAKSSAASEKGKKAVTLPKAPFKMEGAMKRLSTGDGMDTFKKKPVDPRGPNSGDG